MRHYRYNHREYIRTTTTVAAKRAFANFAEAFNLTTRTVPCYKLATDPERAEPRELPIEPNADESIESWLDRFYAWDAMQPANVIYYRTASIADRARLHTVTDIK